MKPVDRHKEFSGQMTIDPVDDTPTNFKEREDRVSGDTGWRLWPPSPKMQIAMIALGFGLFNLILIAIWAVVMVYRF
jgi:hypothetical protein